MMIIEYIEDKGIWLALLLLFICSVLLLRMIINDRTNCIECSERISIQAKKCKHCGYLQPKKD